MQASRDVVFHYVDVDGHHFVRVQHTDESLNRLMEQIHRGTGPSQDQLTQ